MMDMGEPSAEDPGATDQPADDSQGFEICIKCTPDGAISVYKEPAAAEAQEQGPNGEPAEQQGQPANSIGEALKLALQIYQSSAAGNAEDQMQAGFNNPTQGEPKQPQGGM